MGDPFVRMNGSEADEQCGTRGGFYPETCQVCKARAILHCSKCKIQVSGCKCTLAAMARAERAKAVARGDEQTERHAALKAKLKDRGMWIP